MVKKILQYSLGLPFLIFFWTTSIFAQCPTTVSISASSGTTICEGDSVTFTANPTGGGNPTYQWKVNDVNAGSDSATFTSTTLSNTDKVKVIVGSTTDSECSGVSSNTLTMTVNPVLTGNAVIQANNTSICPGETVIYSIADIEHHGGSQAKYEWLINGASFSPPRTGNSLSYEPSANEEITLKVDSGLPCVEDFETSGITVSIKEGKPSAPGTISGEATVCPGLSKTYSVGSVATATSYIWELPSGWSGSSSTNSITVTTGTSGGTIKVTAQNDCGTGSSQTLAVNVDPGAPVQPGVITGNGSVCPGSSETYSVTAVANAEEYTWTFPAAWNINPMTTSTPEVTVTTGSSGSGNISVVAKNGCGDSSPRALAVTMLPGEPAMPGSITGPTEVCPGVQETYSVTAVPNATEYVWTLPNGIEQITTTPSIAVTTNDSGNSNISVKARNSCGTSEPRNLTVTVKAGTPANAGAITLTYSESNTVICPGESVSFSVTPPTGADTYIWTVPSGWAITGAESGSSITVTAGDYGENGNVTVKPSNSCGTGTESTLAVSVNPEAPEMGSTTIDGPSEVCASATGLVYRIPAINNAQSYTWTFPSGWEIQGAENGNSVTVDAANTSGDIAVTANNACGSSENISMAVVVVSGVPGQPGEIDSSIKTNPNICPPFSPVTFNIEPVAGADTYLWHLPQGWEFISGEGTNNISVKISSTVDYDPTETVSVQAVNLCGSSEERVSFPVNMANHIITDIGEDITVCKTTNPITINANILFGSAKFKPVITSTGSGSILTNPGNLNQINGKITITYTPSSEDIKKDFVTLSIDVPEPNSDNSACKAGFDEMTIFFRQNPTAAITGSSEICMGSSTKLTITGTPNTTVTYAAGSTDKTIGIGASGSAILDTGFLNQSTDFVLKSIQYSEGPSCPVNITGTATVTINPHPTAEFINFKSEYCNADTSTYTPELDLNGAHGEGGFSASSSSLIIDQETGAFSPLNVPAGTYTITYTFDDEMDCGYQPVSTEITIHEKVTITEQPTGTRVCEGQPVELSVAATGDGLSYQWYNENGLIPGADAASYSVPAATAEDEGDYYVIVIGTDPCSSVTSSTVEVLIDNNISINSLSSDTSICENGEVTFEVEATATGETLSYVWHKDGTPLGTETSSSLALSSIQLSDAGSYTVVVSGATGFECNSVTSDPIVLTVRATPNVQISGDAAICDGGTAVISFENGLPNGIVTYNINNGNSSTIQLDATGKASLDTGSLAYSAGETTDYVYTLESISYSDAPECSTTVTGAATVKVSPLPEASFSFPDGQISFCNTASQPDFTPVITGTTGGNFSAPGLNIDPDTGAFSPSGIAAGSYTITYAIPASGGCTEETATLDITIHKEVKITSQPFNTGICSGETTQFEVTATGDNLAYQWYRGTIPGTAISGATSNILEISPASIEDDGPYYVSVSGAGACTSINSQVVTLNVDENIIIETQPTDQEVCLGTDVIFTIAATATGGDPVYQWKKDGEDLDGETGNTLSLAAVTLADAGEYTVFIQGPDGYTCSTITSGAAVLTVNEPPTAEAGENFTACYTTETIAISTGASAEHYSSLEWSHNGAGNLSDANALEARYTPAVGESGSITFTLTAFGNTCEEIFDTKTLEIQPVPVITQFSYSAGEFCETDSEIKIPVLTGSNAYSGGTFEVEPSTGLSIDSEGKIDPSNSDPGTYVIIYSTPTGAVCEPIKSEAVTIVIGELPIAEFAYDNTIFCKDTRDDTQNIDPTITMSEGAVKGVFSYTGEGTLVLDPATGAIDLTDSDPGAYKVTNTLDYSGEEEDGCAAVSFSVDLTINEKPIPDFAYSSTEYCSDNSNPSAQFTEAGSAAGVFSEKSGNSGLVFSNPTTGEIDLAASTPGTYTIVNTLEAVGACEPVSAEQAVTINKKAETNFSYSKEAYCFSEGVATISLPEGYEHDITFSNETLADFLNEDTGELTWTSENATAIVGIHTISYIITGTGGCSDISGTLPLVIDAVPVGGELAFEGNGRIFMTCEGAVPGYASPLILSGFQGEIVNWEYHDEFTTTWSTYDSQATSLTSSEIESIVANKSTIFRVIVKNGACEGGVYSATAVVSVIPTDIEPTPVTVAPNVLCYGNEVTLSSETGYGDSFGNFGGGAFDNAGIKNNGWSFTNLEGGSNDFTSGANNGRADHWLRMNPHGQSPANEKVYTANLDNPTTGTMVNWDTSIYPEGNKGFAIVTGDNDSYMETPVFSLDGMDVAILTFDQAYNITEGTHIRVEISTDGGNTYQSEPLFEMFGTATSGNYDNFGDKTPEERPLNKMEIDLGKYFGYTNLRIRFNYIGSIDGDVWAVDDIKVPDGAQGAQLIWYYDDDISDPNNQLDTIGQVNQYVVNYTPKKIGWNDFEVRTAILLDSNGDACETLEHAKTRRVFVFDQYTTTVDFEVGLCGDTSAELTSFVTGAFQGEQDPSATTLDGYKGRWNIVALSGTEYTLKNPDGSVEPDPLFNPNAILESENLGDFEVSWVLEQTLNYPEDYYVEELQGQLIVNDSCPPVVNTETVTLQHCTTLDFDGVDDYVDLGTDYSGPYSIEAWIRPFERVHPEGGYTNPMEGTIISGPGFEIKMTDLPVNVVPGTRWYHIAVSGGKLYVDGIDSGSAGSGSGGDRALIGAEWDNSTSQPVKFFSGWIEEVRIWNKALDERHIRFMMNQRIAEVTNPSSTTPIEGEVVPIRNVSSYKEDGQGYNLHEFDDPQNPARWYDRQWGDLKGYFRLISAVPDPDFGIVTYVHLQPKDGLTPNMANASANGVLHNMTTHQENTSPLPYLSGANGPWANENTWLRPDVWDFPNSTGINGSTPIEWNIAQTSHKIHSNKRDITLLGLISVKDVLDMEGTIPSPTGNELYISHYLKLDGVIDLNGESQLVQPDGSLAQGSGSLERDQQGTGSSFNYNYWSSPVSTAFGNTTYSVAGVMFDGTDVGTGMLAPIKFGGGPFYADTPRQKPIWISNYWIFAFLPEGAQENANMYSKWKPISSTGTIKIGEGYTMKGTWNSAVGPNNMQNYTFNGFPNNGDIEMSKIHVSQNYLIGNPYPSAISADKFINDNNGAINGAVYFWDHFGGQSHYLKEYVGGYATRNLIGGVPASSVDERINNNEEASGRSPGPIIPVGQGFYINSTLADNPTTQEVIFNNTQRVFVTEADGGQSYFHSQEELVKKKENSPNATPLIRFDFKSPKGYWRQIAVGAHPKTTAAVDYGYDAPLLDNNSEDMFWMISDRKFVIQGVPHFDSKQVLPLGIKIAKAGKFSIKVAALEHLPANTEIYMHDKLYDLYYDISQKEFSAKMEPGEYKDRYEIVFEEPQLVDDSEILLPGVFEILYVNGTREIKLRNPQLRDVSKVFLTNILGQQVHVYHHIPTEHEVSLPVQRFSSGVYIVKVHLGQNIITEKIILE